MPFHGFLHINVLLIESSFECGWLHIAGDCMNIWEEDKQKASRGHGPILREHFDTLHVSLDLDIADKTACRLEFCE